MHVKCARIAATILFAANGLTFATWAASIPRVAERLKLTPGSVAIAVFTVSLGSIAAMPVVGRLVDRFGAERIALAGAALLPLLLPFVVEATSFAQLLAGGIVFGVMLGTMEVGMNAYAVAAERAAGAAWISQAHGVWSVGNVLGSLAIAGLIASRTPLPSLASALAVAIAVLIAARLAVPVPHREPVRGAAAPHVALVILGLFAAAGLLVEGAMADWAALYLRRDLGASAALAPLGYTAFSGAMMAARFIGDATVLRFGRSFTLATSGAISAVALAVALSVPNAFAACVAYACVGIGCANLAPTVFGVAGRLAAGTGVATVTGIGYAAFLVGPALIGGAAQLIGLHLALWIVVACAAGVAIAALTPRLRYALASE